MGEAPSTYNVNYYTLSCDDTSVRAGAARSATVEDAAEVEVEVQHATLEGALVAVLVGILPLLADDLEGDVFVRRARREADDAVVGVRLALDLVRGRFARVDEIRVEDVELYACSSAAGWMEGATNTATHLVALHDLGRWVVLVVCAHDSKGARGDAGGYAQCA
jgi:hypothetical protein